MSAPTGATLEAPRFLPVYFETLDEQALDALPMLADGFRFSFLWSDERGPREFTGGLEDFPGYLAQRRAEGQRHHIDVGAREGRVEVVLGHTTRWGERLGNFTFVVWLDAEGRAERLYSGRQGIEQQSVEARLDARVGPMLGVHVEDLPLDQLGLAIILERAFAIEQQIVLHPKLHRERCGVEDPMLGHARISTMAAEG